MYNQKTKENGVIHFEDENGGGCLREIFVHICYYYAWLYQFSYFT